MLYKSNGLTPVIGEGCVLAPSADIIGDVTLGKNCSIWFNTTLRGDVHHIKLGDNCNVQDNSCLHVTKGTHPLTIHEGVTIGHQVTLHGCEIGHHTLVGMGAIILDGVKIGEECLIGAGCLITGNTKIPAGSLVYGNPGRVVRPLKKEEITNLYKSEQNYLEYKEKFLRTLTPLSR